MSYEGGGLADFPRKEPGVRPACLTSKRAPKYVLDHVRQLEGIFAPRGINASPLRGASGSLGSGPRALS